MEIIFQLKNQIIARADSNILAAKSKNYVQAKFELLSDDWTAPITAIFNDYTVVLDEDNRCMVPWEVLTNPGKVTVSAFCGDLHTATSVVVPVHPGGYIDGQTPQPPTPGVYEQLADMVQTAVETANDVKRRADSGEFDGRDGQDGAPGTAGADAPQIDDTQASPEHPWSGEKIHAEFQAVQKSLDYLLEVKAPKTFDEIKAAVQTGMESQYFSVGDQIKPNWSDGTTVYEDPFDIVQLGHTYDLEDGHAIRGMMLHQHYSNVKVCVFDAQEALYDADEELPAGTYHFTVAGHALPNENGKSIQFTLSKPIPAGGQLVYGHVDGYNKILAGQQIKTYSGPADFSEIESVVLSEGSGGTNLGTTDGKGNLNHNQRAFRGSNRWKTSMLRQYLNSDKPAGQWWTKQDKWDRATSFINTVPGYMSGFDPEFLAVIKPVKVQTARDTVVSDGGIDITFDRFFPVSLEQLNVVPLVDGAEGNALDYWKAVAAQDVTGNLDNGKFKRGGRYTGLITYALHAKTNAYNCWLRSVSKSSPISAWFISPTGGISEYHAYDSDRCTPACVIG